MLSAFRRSRIFWSVLAVGLLVLLLFVGSLFTPFYGEICTKNEYTNQKDCASYHVALVFLWQVAKTLNEYGTATTAIATALLAAITWFLVRFARDQSRTTRAQLRAYVLVSGAEVTDIGNRDSRRVTLTIKNFGQTPAHDVKFWMGTGLREFPLYRLLEPPSEPVPMSSDVLAPGRVSIMILAVPRTTDGQEESIRGGKGAIYAFGQATYFDVFNIERQTDFRYMCHGDGLAKGFMGPCQEGNKYT